MPGLGGCEDGITAGGLAEEDIRGLEIDALWESVLEH